MARIPEAEIERLKSEVSVERLVEAAGIELKKAGKDLIGRWLVSSLKRTIKGVSSEGGGRAGVVHPQASRQIPREASDSGVRGVADR
jgi:hypothetical protein